MAIKTISQLNRIDNGTATGSAGYGGIMHSLKNTNWTYRSDAATITTKDKTPTGSSIQKNTSCHPLQLERDESSYHQMLFEVSKPSTAGIGGAQGTETTYESFCVTYEDVAKNIIYDTKAYLNYTNCLDDFNIRAIVFDNYNFTGSKTFNGDFSVNLSKNSWDTNAQSQFSITNGGVTFGECSNKSFTCNLDTNLTKKLNVTQKATFQDNVQIDKSLTVNYNIESQNLTLSGTSQITTEFLSSRSDTFTFFKYGSQEKKVVVNGSIEVTVSSTFNGDVDIKGCLNVTKNITAEGDISGKNITASEQLNGNTLSVISTATIGGDTNIKGKLTVGADRKGKIEAGECDLTALYAKWSDLAEFYLGDRKYSPGTLVKFGGENEITIADDEVNGVITTNPALVMNYGLKNDELGCPVALMGRVPVRIIGEIRKFQKIMLSETNGVACVWDGHGTIIGRALETNLDSWEKLVECVVKLEL